jgi:hypothetical protein
MKGATLANYVELKDLVKDKEFIKAWHSRSQNGADLIAVKATREIVFVKEGQYALRFKNTTYINNISPFLSNFWGSYSFLCITFRTSGSGEQVWITNYRETFAWREIVVTQTEIYIDIKDDGFNKRRTIIQHDTSKWTSLLLKLLIVIVKSLREAIL